MYPECVVRIHREYAVAMALTPIDGDPTRQLRSIFGRRGPWVAARKEITVEHSKTADTEDLIRPGPKARRIIIHIFQNLFLFLF